MMETTLAIPLTEVLIFETNISSEKDIIRLRPVIAADARIKKWNVDREDVSKVLRIEAQNVDPLEVIEIVTKAGYHCVELQD